MPELFSARKIRRCKNAKMPECQQEAEPGKQRCHTSSMTTQRSCDVRERLERRRCIGELGCWLWTGAQSNGYGTMMVKGRTRYVHVLSFEVYVGPVPPGHQIDHVRALCSNKTCFNPTHLEPVTQRENMARSDVRWAQFARGTCARGHDVTDLANVYTRPDTGKQWCRECRRIRDRERRARIVQR